MFLDANGKPYPYKPDALTGGLPVGVPGILKMLLEVQGRLGSGKISFAELFKPAIRLAETGFMVSPRLANFIEEQKDRIKLFAASKKILFDVNGVPLKSGVLLVQPDLAKTFRLIQKNGISVFYQGEIGDAIVQAVRKAPFHPGYMKKEDLASYRVIERKPLRATYRNFEIMSMPPPSSGGTTLIEALHIAEPFHLDRYGPGADSIHLLSEAQRLAFRDRNRYLGDPGFVKIPVDELISKEFAKDHSQSIRFDHVLPDVPEVPPVHENMHTSHISIVDRQGNMVAFTTTIEHVFGSALMVPGYGFFLNNELTDFELEPKDENGKLKANAPEGDKRPRSSMTPTFIFKEGRPVLVAGSPGGSKIIGIVLNVVVNVLDFEMPLAEAMRAPRMINRDGPVELEPALYKQEALVQNLMRRGHRVIEIPNFGNAQAIYFDREREVLVGESDPRGEGEALGY